MKIVADDKIPFLRGALEPFAEMVYLPGAEIGRSELMDADVLMTRTRTKCDRALLEGTRVRLIASATAGYDHIDADACRELGVEWRTAPGCNADSVVQYIASAVMTLVKTKNLNPMESVLGVVGCGQVGSRIAVLGAALGMKVLLNDPPRARVEGGDGFIDIGRIQSEADIITIHVSLNMEGADRTFHLIDGAFLKGIAKKVWLINASRGEVIDTAALKNHMKRDAFQGVVLDVWENEPDIDLDLLEMVDLGSPHIAGYSADGKLKGTTQSVRSISRFFGLGMDDWAPQGGPAPDKNRLKIDCRGRSVMDVLNETVTATYQITEDDLRLRESPELFEKQRGDYPVRRDFNYYSVELTNDVDDVGARLKAMGFRVV